MVAREIETTLEAQAKSIMVFLILFSISPSKGGD